MNKVVLMSCRAYFPFVNFTHFWFVLCKHGECTRWEIRIKKNTQKPKMGCIYSTTHYPFAGIMIFPFFKSPRWPSRKECEFTGEEAERLIQIIENSPEKYPKKDSYKISSANCNTYVKWILKEAKLPHIKISKRAVG